MDTFLKFENKIEDVIPPLVFATVRVVGKIAAAAATNLEESIGEGKASPKSSIQSEQKDEAKSMTSEGDKSTSSVDRQMANEASSKEMKTSEVIKNEEMGDESLSSVKLADRTKSANPDLANAADQARNTELETSRIDPLPILDAFVIKQKSELIDLNKPVRPDITKKDELCMIIL